MYKIRRFFGKIKNVLSYLPLLWKDEQWDYGFLLELIVFKLKKMDVYFSKAKITTPETYAEIREGIQKTIKCLEDYDNDTEYWYKPVNPHWDGFFDTMKVEMQKWWD